MCPPGYFELLKLMPLLLQRSLLISKEIFLYHSAQSNRLIKLDIPFAGAQYRWLEDDLAKVDRSVTPWLIATWHPPWYSSYKAHYREAECMRFEMEELLYSYGVDIIFNGHVSLFPLSHAHQHACTL